jgi:hypothetical protein
MVIVTKPRIRKSEFVVVHRIYNSKGIPDMRMLVVCFLTLFASAQLVQGAAISVTLNGNRAGGSPGEAFTGYEPPATGQSGTGSYGSSLGTFGTVTAGNVPVGGFQANFAAGNYNYDALNRGFVSTGVRWTGSQFFTTTQAWFTQGFTAISSTPLALNSAYWEFTVDGIYDYRIEGQAVQIADNIRTYRFEKVGGNVLRRDDLGKNDTVFTGNINSGTYRLYYDHLNYTPNINGPTGNIIGGTNLNIFFTFKSEDNGVVPEPGSITVFGLLGLGGALAKWRRKS